MRIHVVILAAGRGSRLGPLSDDTSKWLLAIDGKRIADLHLEAVGQARQRSPAAVASVRVVTGHAGAEVERFLEGRSDQGLSSVHNPEFATLNNWYSVLLALESVRPGEEDAVVVLNGDLFAEPEWIARFLVECCAGDSEAMLAVDTERELVGESMKVAARPSSNGEGPALARIGKTDVDDPIGEYVGMLMARRRALGALKAALEGFVGRPEHADEWYERAVGQTAADGTRWTIWPTPSSSWIEIDDRHDYEAAVGLARSG
jgi:choline kinase